MTGRRSSNGGSGSWPQLGALDLEDLLGELRDRAALAMDAQRRMSGLLDAVVAVSSDLDLSVVLSRIVRAACELVEARYGALGVIGPDGERLGEFVPPGVVATPGRGGAGPPVRRPRRGRRRAPAARRPAARPGDPGPAHPRPPPDPDPRHRDAP